MTALDACAGRIAIVCKAALMLAVNHDWMTWDAADRLMATWPRMRSA